MSVTIVDWIGAGASSAAVIVTVIVALIVSRQSESIANDQVRQQREAYLAGRMQELVGHARAVVLEAKTVWSLTSSRFRNELMDIQEDGVAARTSRQERIGEALTRLETEVSLLRAYAVTMPTSIESPQLARGRGAIRRLQDEGTWLSSAAHFAAFTHFEDADSEPTASVFEDLIVGQLENVDNRLLAELPDGTDLSDIPFFSEPGSPWPDILEQRRNILEKSEVFLSGETLPVAANYAITLVLERFQDALIEVLNEWNEGSAEVGRRVRPR